MTDVIKGKSIKTAQDYINGFSKVITNGEPSEGLPTRLQAFAGVHNFPVRVKCAILPWRILEAVIKKIEHLKNNNS
jgi:nitrogen fixation NifU-like protein